MSRFRRAIGFLPTRSLTSSTGSSHSCGSAAAAVDSSSSSSCLSFSGRNPSPALDLSQTSGDWRSDSSCFSSSSSHSCSSWLDTSSPPIFGRSTALSSPQNKLDEIFVSLSRISRPTDVGNDLITGVKQQQRRQQVWLSGHRKLPPASLTWVLRSFPVAYSTDTASSSERDPPDRNEDQQLGTSDLSSSSFSMLQKEEIVAADGDGFYTRHASIPVAAVSDYSLSTTFRQSEGEAEVTTPLDSALSTSTDEDDKCDVSELELLEVEDVDGKSEDLDGNFQSEAEHGRPEEEGDDTQRTYSRLQQMLLGDASEREEVVSSELVSGLLDVVPSTSEDAEGLGVKEFEPAGDRHQGGRPYLHTLTVEEIQEILEKARAKDVRILQVQKSCEWVDQLVFASGRSSRHLRGMADAIVYKVKQRSANVGSNSFPAVEGRDGEQWMAIDCGNIAVHLFLEEARRYYNLEEYWSKKSNPRLVETY